MVGGSRRRPVTAGRRRPKENDLGGDATGLVFRVNRGEILLNDPDSGAVWDIDQDTPIEIDNWEAFTSKKQNNDDENENENQSDADRRPPQAKPDSYGVRAGRTTVLHPLDNDSAPEGRLLSIVDVDQPNGGARVEISPDGQTLILQMPDEGSPRDLRLLHRRRTRRPRGARDRHCRRARRGDNEPPELREGYQQADLQGAAQRLARGPGARRLARRPRRRHPAPRLRPAVGGDESGASARTTADGRIRFTAPTSRPTASSWSASSSPSPTAARRRSRSR